MSAYKQLNYPEVDFNRCSLWRSDYYSPVAKVLPTTLDEDLTRQFTSGLAKFHDSQVTFVLTESLVKESIKVRTTEKKVVFGNSIYTRQTVYVDALRPDESKYSNWYTILLKDHEFDAEGEVEVSYLASSILLINYAVKNTEKDCFNCPVTA